MTATSAFRKARPDPRALFSVLACCVRSRTGGGSMLSGCHGTAVAAPSHSVRRVALLSRCRSVAPQRAQLCPLHAHGAFVSRVRGKRCTPPRVRRVECAAGGEERGEPVNDAEAVISAVDRVSKVRHRWRLSGRPLGVACRLHVSGAGLLEPRTALTRVCRPASCGAGCWQGFRFVGPKPGARRRRQR